ncbi:MAG: endonuclease/exonuclease/phosphatase family protein [Parcubacteria group bacterium]|nr:endonuclease/exonuclease/phosphatase family protein [Parcubacteria group bacterium]
MRVLSWNIWDENQKPATEIAQFIFAQDADIVCLQEVAAPLLHDLVSQLSGVYSWYVAKDAQFTQKNPRALGFFARLVESVVYLLSDAYAHYISKDTQQSPRALLFLSRLPVVRVRAIRTRTKRGWRSFFTAWTKIDEHLEFQRADVQVSNGCIEIMNTHLEVGTSPRNRLNQFKYVLKKRKRRGAIKHAIVVGDLNIFGEGLYPRFVGWMGHGFEHKWLWLNEREQFEKICKKHGLTNIFKGCSTFKIGGSEFQLDHILVPEQITVVSQKVLEDMCGSDHKPIVADIDI